MHSLLVLDANQRSALAVTRSLGRTHQFRITTADAALTALAGQSRYSERYLQYPDPATEPQAFLSWIASQTETSAYDLVIPTTEVTSQLLLQHQVDLPRLKLPFAPYETVLKLADKAALVELAERLKIPVPKSQYFSSAQAVETAQLRFPLVLKPALSHIFMGTHWLHTRVRVLHDLADWHQAMREEAYLKHSPFLLQEFIPGHGAGVFCLFTQGQPVQYFAHERLREKPPEGGVSVLSRSVTVDEKLQRYSETLLSEVHWHGVAMVEFRIGTDGRPYLMEVNTRFWGSLQLAVDSGVDFPALLVRSQLGLPSSPCTRYRVGQRLRWWLGDLDSLYIYLKRPYTRREKLKRVMEFLAIRWYGQRHEINRWSDLKPSWFELKQYIRALRSKA